MVPMMTRFKQLGIQKRIMLYVTVGLVIMFGGFTYIGFLSLRQATDLVYLERLSTAHTTAGILERDFLHVARDVDEVSVNLLTGDTEHLKATAQDLLRHLSKTDPFPFFRVTGIWVLTLEGTVWAVAGEPGISLSGQVEEVLSTASQLGNGEFMLIPAIGAAPGSIPFGTIVIKMADPWDSDTMLVAAHTVSVNSVAPYIPAVYWRTDPNIKAVMAQNDESDAQYNMEVVDTNGLTVLAIGEDERPGEVSRHFSLIRSLIAQRKAAAVLHKPSSGDTFEPHVMAVAPLGSSPFYVIQEQSTDVALALHMELRRRVLMVASLGFVATLLIAWITTRHVVKPTKQLTAAAQRMSLGDLSSPIEVSAQDEVGKLAESLELMRQQLKDSYQKVSRAKGELEARVNERTVRLTEVLVRVISAQEDERRRLARELHDETAQTISALSIVLGRVHHDLRGASPDTIKRIQEAQDVVSRLLDEIRRLILDLRPMALEDLGLVSAVRWYAESHLEEQGVKMTVEVDAPSVRLPPHLETSLFRIIQEAINNIARHAQAQEAHIRLLLRGSTARIEVSDDGKGFDVEKVLRPQFSGQGVGLLGIQERAYLLGGRFDIHSHPGQGTQIIVEVPIPIAEERL